MVGQIEAGDVVTEPEPAPRPLEVPADEAHRVVESRPSRRPAEVRLELAPGAVERLRIAGSSRDVAPRHHAEQTPARRTGAAFEARLRLDDRQQDPLGHL
ncbi:MAG: hypothetical protein DWQ36_20290 [Acidobacteria bacterium]|nr:MAG: hypothetical protein DWQ30_10245 [Acidobacteriota bacterium]REK03209.1 MAG: hypothetical protein DWQ36_20290 [Acidobacteriota bacterium]